ncbi:MAG: spore coat associated protein CotJA [Firmicutes bacterium]|nr:spore coat associated protein CotJA [Bacillota bacterium]
MDKQAQGTTAEMTTMQLGRAYVPFQVLGEMFTPEQALMKGTLFPDLYRPYKPGKWRY